MPRDGSGIYTLPFPDVVTNTTIASTVENGTWHDWATDANAARPIVAGGTGATSAPAARTALQAERSMQGPVTNFDTQVWEAGSFYANAGATNAPTANACMGTVSGPDASGNYVVQATDVTTGLTYTRRKTGGTWAVSWTTGIDPTKVAKAGDTMTGDLHINYATPQLWLDRPSGGGFASINYTYNGLQRWNIGVSGTESTGNAGSDLIVTRYSDAGGALSSPLTINRASGLMTVVGDPTAALGVATKQYADGRVAKTGDTMSGGLTVTGTSNGLFVANPGASANPNVQIRPGSDVNMALGIINNAGTAWAHAFYGSGAYNLTGNVSASATGVAGYAFSTNSYSGLNVSSSTASGGINYQYVWNTAGAGAGSATWYVATQPGVHQWATLSIASSAFQFYETGEAYKAAGGPWASNSDARIKNVLGDYEHGLDEIMALRPVRFTFKGNDTNTPPANVAVDGMPVSEDRADDPVVVPYDNSPHGGVAKLGIEYVGLIAQEVEPIMPEMVSTKPAYIDGQPVDDLRNLDTNALIYALVNAVKTLAARVAALEAAP